MWATYSDLLIYTDLHSGSGPGGDLRSVFPAHKWHFFPSEWQRPLCLYRQGLRPAVTWVSMRFAANPRRDLWSIDRFVLLGSANAQNRPALPIRFPLRGARMAWTYRSALKCAIDILGWITDILSFFLLTKEPNDWYFFIAWSTKSCNCKMVTTFPPPPTYSGGGGGFKFWSEMSSGKKEESFISCRCFMYLPTEYHKSSLGF
jgi:hypothetical protein